MFIESQLILKIKSVESKKLCVNKLYDKILIQIDAPRITSTSTTIIAINFFCIHGGHLYKILTSKIH